MSVVFFFVSAQTQVFGQKKFSKSYPASKNIRLELSNRSGTVTVEGWNRDEVRISAVLGGLDSILGAVIAGIMKEAAWGRP